MKAEPDLYAKPFSAFQKIAGNLFFAVLAIYSIVYVAERTIYIDSAWLFFERVNGECFSFPGSRYSAFFSEILLYISVKLHLPFRMLFYVFSTSYIILYYIIWRICTYRLKNAAAGLVILFGMFMGVRETFLHPVSETHQMIVYSALLYALLFADFGAKIILKNALIIFTTLLVLFCHPFGIFTAGFAIAYYMVSVKAYKEKIVWIAFAIVLIGAIYNFLHPANPYDAEQFDQLKKSSSFSAFTQSGALNFVKIHFTHFYWLPELGFLIAAVWLVFKKEWLRLSALVVSVAAYLIIASITFSRGDSSIMIERIFLPALFMINLALADLLAKQKNINKWIPMMLVIFFMINGIRYINAGCLMYKKRVVYIDKLVQEGIAQGNDKYVLTDAKTDMERILVPWAFGTETLLYSKFKYDKCISITVKDEICSQGNCRMTNVLCLPVAKLNKNYFQLTNSAYIELK